MTPALAMLWTSRIASLGAVIAALVLLVADRVSPELAAA